MQCLSNKSSLPYLLLILYTYLSLLVASFDLKLDDKVSQLITQGHFSINDLVSYIKIFPSHCFSLTIKPSLNFHLGTQGDSNDVDFTTNTPSSLKPPNYSLEILSKMTIIIREQFPACYHQCCTINQKHSTITHRSLQYTLIHYR